MTSQSEPGGSDAIGACRADGSSPSHFASVFPSRTFGSSCSARPAITPSGVDTSCATPIARVPNAAARVAEARRSFGSSRKAARASSLSSLNSFLWVRRATTPKASSNPVVVRTLRMERACVQRSRSRSRRAVAATAMVHPASGPRLTVAKPTNAARVGRPNAPASVLERDTTLSPRRAASTTWPDKTDFPSLCSKREPSGDSRNTLKEPCRSTAASSRGTRSTTASESQSVLTPRAEAIPCARFTCSSARSSSAAREARAASHQAKLLTIPIAIPTDHRRRNVRRRARRAGTALILGGGRSMGDSESLATILTTRSKVGTRSRAAETGCYPDRALALFPPASGKSPHPWG